MATELVPCKAVPAPRPGPARVSWWIVVLLYFGPAFLGSLGAGFGRPVLFSTGDKVG